MEGSSPAAAGTAPSMRIRKSINHYEKKTSSTAVPEVYGRAVMGYLLKECLANAGNYGRTRTAAQIKYTVFHYTGNDGDKAANNAAYFQNNIVKASAHYFVDDACVYRSVPDLRGGFGQWAAQISQRRSHRRRYHIWKDHQHQQPFHRAVRIPPAAGVCQASEATMENAAALGRKLMAKYNIPLSNVYRHFDVTGKHCPSYLISAPKWAEFKARLEEERVVRYQCLKDVPAAFQPTIKNSDGCRNPAGRRQRPHWKRGMSLI